MVINGSIICNKESYSMNKGTNRKSNQSTEDTEITESLEKISKAILFVLKFLNTPIISGIIATLAVTFIIYLFSGIKDVLLLPERFDEFEVRIGNLESFHENESLEESPNSNSIDIDININGSDYVPTESGAITVIEGSEEIPYIAAPPSWSFNDKILENTNTGEKYLAEQCVGQQMFFPYKNGNQEVYFWGQFNENNQWHGNCILNAYENNKLISILEAEYDNGILLSYKQATPSTISDTWRISDRKKEVGYNSGKTWNYAYVEYPQKFDTVESEDILYIRDFETYIKENSWLEGFYFGNTSNGLYNDNTGKAYLIKYYEDGTVQLLYAGKFAEGYPSDKAAWSIVYSEDGKYYVQNTGEFKRGSAVIKSNQPLSINNINEIISKYESEFNFEGEFIWKQN